MAFINDFLSLIYPRYCEACEENLHRHELHLCNDCLLNLPKSSYHPGSSADIEGTFSGRIPVIHASSFYVYQKCGRVQKLLHAIKYQGQKELGEYIGQLYAGELLKDNRLQGVDMLIPVPLHANKLKQRGYNQSEWFAKGLASGSGLKVETGLLERHVDTQTQTKKKKFQRWENVEGIFKIRDAGMAKDKHILLVDDVITTGATLEAAWLALKEIDGVQVSVASIAFAGRI